MFCNYEDKPNIAYKLLLSELENGHISHAYLINENNNCNAFLFALNFAKAVFCKDVINLKNKEIICKKVDNGNYSKLKILKPMGNTIKKQQILDLQQDFSKIALDGGYQIYIICECDKMKQEAANAILKFLEEPNDNIIAILLTNNYNSVLPTIISRCQNIKLDNNLDDLDNSNFSEISQEIVDFIANLEKKGLNTLLNKDSIFLNKEKIKDKSILLKCYDLLVSIYYEALRRKCGREDTNAYDDIINVILENNNLERLENKVNFMVLYKEKIKYNLNVNLFNDNFIIKMVNF